MSQTQVRTFCNPSCLVNMEAGVIELPFPDKALWPNGRPHYMAKHRAFQKHKDWAYHAMLAILPRCYRHNGKRIEWTITVYPKPKTTRAIDKDNAASAMKAYQDGFALAMGIDDSLFEQPRIQFGENVPNGKIVVSLS